MSGKGRRRSARGDITITDFDIEFSEYNSWESVGMVTGEIRRRNKTRPSGDQLETKGTKADMIRTLLVDDNDAAGRTDRASGRSSGKPPTHGLQKRTDRGAGSSGNTGTAEPPTATKEDTNKENVGPSGRTTRSRNKTVSSMATTKAKTANGKKKTDASGKAAGTKKTDTSGKAQAGDIILVDRGGGKEETAEVLDIDGQIANLCFEGKEEDKTPVKLSDLAYTIKDKYVEPVPQHQDLPDYSDVAPGAPKYKPDDPKMLLQLMSGSYSLDGVSYDEDLLR